MCRQRCTEYQVGKSCRERETCSEAKCYSNCCKYSVKDCIYKIQCRSKEHKCELERLSNTTDECTDSCCAHQGSCCFLFLRFCTVNDCHCCCRKTEHHTWEESSHVHTSGSACSIEKLACPVGTKVIDTCCVKPEYRVQCVMQTKRDQKTVQECIDTYTNCAKSYDALTNCYQCGINDRPYEEQDCGYYDRNNCSYDCYATFSGEE